ncbi:protein SLC31A2-like isoform X2 [Lycorma delicatula]|uniref:protein SLC31A2-like isoform X2 n=1 Tax=Lycorma delicatula TaxID=130591 RepID=UPI003F5192E1
MHDSFWFGYSIKNFLFEGLNINSVGGCVLVCVILTMCAALFEAVKLCQITIKLKSLLLFSPTKLSIFCVNSDQSSLLRNSSMSDEKVTVNKSRFLLFVFEVASYVGQVFLGYILMLAVMTFNGFLSIALILGAGLGYYLFGLQCAQARMSVAKLKVPCQHCLQNNKIQWISFVILMEDLHLIR